MLFFTGKLSRQFSSIKYDFCAYCTGVTSYQFSSMLPLLSLLGFIAAADLANKRVLGVQTARGQVNG